MDGCVDRIDYGAPHLLDKTDCGVTNTDRLIITSVCVLHTKSVELSPCADCIFCKLDSIMSSHLIKSFVFSPYTLAHDTRVCAGYYPQQLLCQSNELFVCSCCSSNKILSVCSFAGHGRHPLGFLRECYRTFIFCVIVSNEGLVLTPLPCSFVERIQDR